MAVEQKVKQIIVEQLGVDENQVDNSASFVDDLGADSLDIVELVMAFEEAFELEIPDEDAEKIATVKDALNAKPAESAALDVVINPSRLGKLVEKFGGNPLEIERAIGKDDKLISAGSLRVISGKELTLRLAVNMKIGPRALFESTIRRD